MDMKKIVSLLNERNEEKFMHRVELGVEHPLLGTILKGVDYIRLSEVDLVKSAAKEYEKTRTEISALEKELGIK